MAIPHNTQVWDNLPAGFGADVDPLDAPDSFLEEDFEDMTSGTMFDSLDD